MYMQASHILHHKSPTIHVADESDPPIPLAKADLHVQVRHRLVHALSRTNIQFSFVDIACTSVVSTRTTP